MKTNSIHTAKVKHPDFFQDIDQLFIDGLQIGDVINDLIKRRGSQSIINYSSEIFIGSASTKNISIKNSQVATDIPWWWRLMNFVRK